MKTSVVVLFVIAAAAPWPAAASCGAQEAVLRQIKLEAWPGYYRRQDAAGLGDFLHEGFRVIGGDGSVTSRAEELAWVAKSSWSPQRFVYTITSISCPQADTALVVGEGRFEADKDGARYEHRYVSSNVLVLVGGRWRAALSHLSGERSRRLAN